MAKKSKTKPPTSSITMKQALSAARRVKKKFEKSPQLPASWKKGGRNYERVLGRFGTA